MALLKNKIILEDINNTNLALRRASDILAKLDKKNLFAEYPDFKELILGSYADLNQNIVKKYLENNNKLSPKEEENLMDTILEFISELKILDDASE